MLTKMVVYLVPVDLHARSTISLADFDIAKPRDPPTERGGACATAQQLRNVKATLGLSPLQPAAAGVLFLSSRGKTPRKSKRRRKPARQH